MKYLPLSTISFYPLGTGHRTARKLDEKFETHSPPAVPVDSKQTSKFLRVVGEKLNVPNEVVEEYITKKENERTV